MPIATGTPALDHFATPPLPVKRFTVEDYLRLARHGYFIGGDRYELLEGWIVPKVTKNPPHAVATDLADDALCILIRGTGYCLRNQNSVATADSVPEPDLAIVRGTPRDYSARHPGPEDTALAVEVADSSLAGDRKLKGRIYARAGIPQYWIIHLAGGQIEVYAEPSGPADEPAFRSRRDYGPGEAIPLVLGGHEIGRVAVEDLLP